MSSTVILPYLKHFFNSTKHHLNLSPLNVGGGGGGYAILRKSRNEFYNKSAILGTMALLHQNYYDILTFSRQRRAGKNACPVPSAQGGLVLGLECRSVRIGKCAGTEELKKFLNPPRDVRETARSFIISAVLRAKLLAAYILKQPRPDE